MKDKDKINTLEERLVLNFNELNEIEQKEVVDFIEFLKYKKEKELLPMVNDKEIYRDIPATKVV